MDAEDEIGEIGERDEPGQGDDDVVERNDELGKRNGEIGERDDELYT